MSYATLLVFLSLLLLLSPVLGEAGLGFWIIYVLTPAVLLAATWAASESRRLAQIAVLLLLLDFGLVAAEFLSTAPWLLVVERAVGASLFLFTSLVLLYHVMTRRLVTGDTILGGICVYLLFACFFYYTFCILELLEPGSFHRAGEDLVRTAAAEEGRFPDLFYFSFVTLTTLGYGDIVPVKPLARSLSTFEAVVGQLYVAILVASLVGMRLASRARHEGDLEDDPEGGR